MSDRTQHTPSNTIHTKVRLPNVINEFALLPTKIKALLIENMGNIYPVLPYASITNKLI
jgi:hypothetical protein